MRSRATRRTSTFSGYDDSLEDADALPAPTVLAAEIAEDLEAALTEFAKMASTLSARLTSSES